MPSTNFMLKDVFSFWTIYALSKSILFKIELFLQEYNLFISG